MSTTKKKKDTHFIKIKPELLFDLDKNFKSEFTPWVYLYLKLKYIWYMAKSPNLFYKIRLSEISDEFKMNNSTTHRAMTELINFGLIRKQNSKYCVKYECTFFPKVIVAPEDTILEFIKINYNAFEELIGTLRSELGSSEMIIKTLRVYYYLILKNKHCLTEKFKLESEETQSSLSRKLKHDSRTIKLALSVLESLGYIDIIDGRLTTIIKPVESQDSQCSHHTHPTNDEVDNMSDDTDFESNYEERNEVSVVLSSSQKINKHSNFDFENSLPDNLGNLIEYVQYPEFPGMFINVNNCTQVYKYNGECLEIVDPSQSLLDKISKRIDAELLYQSKE